LAAQSSEIISGLGAGIAFFAMIVTLWFGRRNLNLQIAATEYFEDFQKWADQLSDALTEAEHLCDLDPQAACRQGKEDIRWPGAKNPRPNQPLNLF